MVIGKTPHGPLSRYVKLRVAHAPGLLRAFSPPPRVSYPDIHHGSCVTHVPWCMPGPLISGFPWSRRWGKRSWHSRRMRNRPFCVSGKRPIVRDCRVWLKFYYCNLCSVCTIVLHRAAVYQEHIVFDLIFQQRYRSTDYISEINDHIELYFVLSDHNISYRRLVYDVSHCFYILL